MQQACVATVIVRESRRKDALDVVAMETPSLVELRASAWQDSTMVL